MQGADVNAAPVAILNGGGVGNHVVFVGTTKGQLLRFAWQGFGKAGPTATFDLRAALPAPAGGAPKEGIVVAGN
jgi:hypothetical protein